MLRQRLFAAGCVTVAADRSDAGGGTTMPFGDPDVAIGFTPGIGRGWLMRGRCRADGPELHRCRG